MPHNIKFCLARTLLILLFLEMKSLSCCRALSPLLRRVAPRLSTTARYSSSSTDSSSPPMVPQGGVSVCVQCRLQPQPSDTPALPYYLLIQRGKQPNKGMWSLPGGRIEFQEGAVAGGMRELREETIWSAVNDAGDDTTTPSTTTTRIDTLQWYPEVVCTTDAIGSGYHYLIAHCYCQLPGTVSELPAIEPNDDAAAAGWFSLSTIQQREQEGDITIGVVKVIERIELLCQHDLLPTTMAMSTTSS